MLTRTSETSASTLLEAVRLSLIRSTRYDPGTLVPPAAVLWTDADGQWQPLVSQLRRIMPQLLTLGDYNPEEKTGPAIWLRCAIERMLSEIRLPEDVAPIIYMPNVSRQILRAGEECRDSLKPLVELQYRGTVWMQRNGRDWTVEAFLVAEEGLGLDVSRDKQTRTAMLRALPQLATTPVSRLRGKRLEAEDFNTLMVTDTPKDLLSWLNDSSFVRETWEKAKWEAFCSLCKDVYGFDPETDGKLVAAEKLGRQEQEEWKTLWERYTESATIYPNIPDVLRRAKPAELIFNKEPWPDENEREEEKLRQSLLGLEGLTPAAARLKIEQLEREHGTRREWVWANLGKSPLAEALRHLVTLARTTSQSLGGDTPKTMADLYVEGGYLADDAALRAIGSVRSAEDTKAVQIAIRSIYLPWLDDAAQHLQSLIRGFALPSIATESQALIEAGFGQCLLFVDGLRFDVAMRLVAMAEKGQLQVDVDWRWAGLPTVTATCKPVVSPLAGRLIGSEPGDELAPQDIEDDKPLTTYRFRKLLMEAGYHVLDSLETGQPDDLDARGWTEFGEFDKLGHSSQSRLAAHIDEHLDLVLERIQALLAAGWKQVRVVTDHGWLLVPGGLPAISLPKYLTESRWTRCATIRPGAHVDVPTAEWYWNPNYHFAFAPGVACFVRGNEYTHGGISLQECLIPVLTFTSSRLTQVVATINEIQWYGMRCRVEVDSSNTEIMADLRMKPNDPNSSIASPKQVDANGRVSLIVSDDSLEGTTVSLVLIDQSGRVLARKATTVGGDD
ncbi:MAG TPA: BREX-1 system phosphatase PglZ type B [Firmicutes bacterium]|nr:BREX-1 system phosphatase PglZ type B [Bacillota bacterium]